jgi:choline dehydrogenase-like flavoprotein
MRLMAERVGLAGHVTGIDVDADVGAHAVEGLRAAGHRQCTFQAADAENPDALPAGPFDLVFARLLLLYVDDPAAVLRSLWDRVAVDGQLVIMEHDIGNVGVVPPLESTDEFFRVVLGTFAGAAKGTQLGRHLPLLHAQAGICAPDGSEVVGRLEPLRVDAEMFAAIYRNMLPAAISLGITTQARGERWFGERGRAVGVHYRETDVRAAEVVLSAGAVKTPQLLLLSGIGPDGPVVDAPAVGRGLQDHPVCVMEWSTPNTRNLWEEATPENLALWQREGEGPFASSGAETVAFARSGDGAPAPDLLLGPLPGPAPDDGLTMPDRRGVASLVMALDIQSRGSVTLRSADPRSAPAIDPGYLAEPADLDMLVAGVRTAREIAECQPLAGHTAGERTPGSEVDDDDGIREWIRASVITAYHPACSCAMGGSDDAVCDPDLRVRGIDGLSVVDASVMPKLPRGNTNAPTIAIAERAADLIRA